MHPNQTYSPAYLAEDKSQNLINVVVAFAILDTLFICLFFTSRIIGHTANGLDMYLMIPAYLFAFADMIMGARKLLARVFFFWWWNSRTRGKMNGCMSWNWWQKTKY